jgi:hypothetical protein
MNWLLWAVCLLVTAQPARQPVPALAGNWKGYVQRQYNSKNTLLLIIRQDSTQLHGYSRSFMDDGGHADCVISGYVNTAASLLELREDSVTGKKDIPGDGPLQLETYRLTWNSTLDTLTGHAYSTVKGRINKKRASKVVFWRVKEQEAGK